MPVWSHVPCITDANARDIRFDQWRLDIQQRQAWTARLRSEWCLHWACEEASPDWKPPLIGLLRHRLHSPQPKPTKTPFLDVLTTCKRM
jgi:hypothetical protein